ncbi:MAG: PQQ-binding-like beta-propeller repeat protein [Bacteroidetes bacterium]|nr:PQQ-binding-like beta-propeller repeat protein [Bacteroidota bacterium]
MNHLKTTRALILIISNIFLILGCSSEKEESYTNWAGYLGGPGTNQYSELTQIDTSNVSKLKVAWTYHSGDADSLNRSQIQCNPLIVDGILYGTSPQLKLFALDAATGEELWVFDPFENNFQTFGMGVNRGVCYWENEGDKRILYTAGPFIWAVNAETGISISDFGEDGKVDLHKGLDRDVDNLFIVSNTPGIIYKDLLIMGDRVSEDVGAAPGHIRAYNVITGKQEWIFHTIPHPGEFGHDTWPEDAWQQSGGANAWAGMSLDTARGWVFVPTGSASYDFYGSDRPGNNLFANTLLALDARTGERIWHYQMVHHDLWDRDLPCPPNLITVNHNGKEIEAVAQLTKSSYIFLFNRETGEPLFPIEEKPVPESTLEGEWTSATQPFPLKPPPFSRHKIDESDLTNLSPDANQYAKKVWDQSLKGGQFIPPSLEGTLLFPGFDGGGEWGGGAYDPETGLFYINASEMPWILQMVPYEANKGKTAIDQGENVYKTRCMICHGEDMEGSSIFGSPSLHDVAGRIDVDSAIITIKNGRGVMPSFGQLGEAEIFYVTAFLYNDETIAENIQKKPASKHKWPYPYVLNGYNRFETPEGYPAIKPPWGTLNAINLNTGVISWKITLGEFPELTKKGIPPTGTELYGGPVVTKGGLIFVASTQDEKIRAFNKRNGELLWEADLPAAGYATPSVYGINGKQYIVVAAGGGKLGSKSGDAYVAFSLD